MLVQFNENGTPMTRYNAQTKSMRCLHKQEAALRLCLWVSQPGCASFRYVDIAGAGSRKQ